MTKSIIQEVNIDVGISDGFRRPVGKDVDSLVVLQMLHAAINLPTKHTVLATKQVQIRVD